MPKLNVLKKCEDEKWCDVYVKVCILWYVCVCITPLPAEEWRDRRKPLMHHDHCCALPPSLKHTLPQYQTSLGFTKSAHVQY